MRTRLRSNDEVKAMRERLTALQREPALPADHAQIVGAIRLLAWLNNEPDPGTAP